MYKRALNNFVAVEPVVGRKSGLLNISQFQEYLVKYANKDAEVAPGDVVVAPANAGVQFDGLTILRERDLVLLK